MNSCTHINVSQQSAQLQRSDQQMMLQLARNVDAILIYLSQQRMELSVQSMKSNMVFTPLLKY